MSDNKFPDRHKYLGASEIGQALNMSDYGTSYELWEKKTLRAGPTGHKDIFDRGHFMESAMSSILLKRYNIKVHSQQSEFVNDERSWLRSHVDGLIDQESPSIGLGDEVDQEGPGVVEFKAPGSRMVDKYSKGGLPGDHLLQMQFNMYNSGCKWGLFVVMDYDNWDIVPIYMQLDEELVSGSLPFLDKFWACVEQDIAPARQEEPYRTVGPSCAVEGLVMEDSPLADELDLASSLLDGAKEASDEVKEKIKAELMKAGSSDATITSPSGSLRVDVKWRETAGKVTFNTGKYKEWVNSLIDAFMHGDHDKAIEMISKYEESTFTKTGEPYRRFTFKVKED